MRRGSRVEVVGAETNCAEDGCLLAEEWVCASVAAADGGEDGQCEFVFTGMDGRFGWGATVAGGGAGAVSWGAFDGRFEHYCCNRRKRNSGRVGFVVSGAVKQW